MSKDFEDIKIVKLELDMTPLVEIDPVKLAEERERGRRPGVPYNEMDNETVKLAKMREIYLRLSNPSPPLLWIESFKKSLKEECPSVMRGVDAHYDGKFLVVKGISPWFLEYHLNFFREVVDGANSLYRESLKVARNLEREWEEKMNEIKDRLVLS